MESCTGTYTRMGIFCAGCGCHVSERERKTGFLFWMPSRSAHSTRQLSVGLMSPAGEDVLGVSRAADFSEAREHSPHELGVI